MTQNFNSYFSQGLLNRMLKTHSGLRLQLFIQMLKTHLNEELLVCKNFILDHLNNLTLIISDIANETFHLHGKQK